MKKDEYKSSKNKIESELNKSKAYLEESVMNLKNIKDKTEEALEESNKNLYSVNKTLNLFKTFPDEIKSTTKVELDEAFNSAFLFGGILAKQSYLFYEKSRDIDNSFLFLPFSTGVYSTSTDAAASSFFTLASEMAEIHTPINEAISQYKLPTILDKKDDIQLWLSKFDEKIGSKYKESFSNLMSSKFMSACHALRECFSHFLESVAPDEEVKQCAWYEEDKNRSRPTQKQRIKYSIIGNSDESLLSDEDFDILDDLMNEGRDIYTKLSNEAHLRKGYWEEKQNENVF